MRGPSLSESFEEQRPTSATIYSFSQPAATRCTPWRKRWVGLQVIYAGKAHPQDESGKLLIQRINTAARQLAGAVTVVYLENHGMELASMLVAGVDVWVNTPVAPHEASGTSGMKAALNGVPSVSVLDGWWLEGHVEGITGWAIGVDPRCRCRSAHRGSGGGRGGRRLPLRGAGGDGGTAYDEDPEGFLGVRRFAIALNGPFSRPNEWLPWSTPGGPTVTPARPKTSCGEPELSSSPRGKYELLHGAGKPSSSLVGGDRTGGPLHLGGGVSHGDAQPGVGKHQDVVGHVADGGDLRRRYGNGSERT